MYFFKKSNVFLYILVSAKTSFTYRTVTMILALYNKSILSTLIRKFKGKRYYTAANELKSQILY